MEPEAPKQETYIDAEELLDRFYTDGVKPEEAKRPKPVEYHGEEKEKLFQA